MPNVKLFLLVSVTIIRMLLMQLLRVCRNVSSWCWWCVRMGDDSCVLNFIEIVPVDDSRSCPESSDVKLSPCHIKVCIQVNPLFVHSYMLCSVVTVTGICNSVGGGVFLTWHHAGGAGGEYEYWWVSRLRLLIENRWMLRLREASTQGRSCPVHLMV